MFASEFSIQAILWTGVSLLTIQSEYWTPFKKSNLVQFFSINILTIILKIYINYTKHQMCLHLYHFFSNQIHRSISPNWKKVWHWLLQWSWISHNKRPRWGKRLIIKTGSFWTFPRIQILPSKTWAFLTYNLEIVGGLEA